MTDQEHDCLRKRLTGLERSCGRWRLAAFGLAGLLVVSTVGAGLLGMSLVQRLRLERARAVEAARRAHEGDERRWLRGQTQALLLELMAEQAARAQNEAEPPPDKD